MNILFFHGDETCPTMGGIQRITARVAEGLTSTYGYRCFNFYNYPIRYAPEIPRYEYVESRQLPPNFCASDLAALIDEWKIDVIVNQQMVDMHDVLKEATERAAYTCKLIYFHHNTPKRLFNLTFNQELLKLRQTHTFKGKFKQLVKLGTYPLYCRLNKVITLKRNRQSYKKIYDGVARFVLLSRKFEKEWHEVTGLSDTSKLRAIPNMLSFSTYISEEEIHEKQKKVLLISRLVEFPKNITSALRIWHKISEDTEFVDWSFDIVGHGRDEAFLREFVSKHSIPRVNFLGRQESEKYYTRSSIFIMTSIREGWGMTLTESLQKGCVPIAFDSFASIHDIIQDGENGFLIPAFEEQEFISRLKELMVKDEMRTKMALQGISSSHRFSSENVIRQWQKLLTEVIMDS